MHVRDSFFAVSSALCLFPCPPSPSLLLSLSHTHTHRAHTRTPRSLSPCAAARPHLHKRVQVSRPHGADVCRVEPLHLGSGASSLLVQRLAGTKEGRKEACVCVGGGEGGDGQQQEGRGRAGEAARLGQVQQHKEGQAGLQAVCSGEPHAAQRAHKALAKEEAGRLHLHFLRRQAVQRHRQQVVVARRLGAAARQPSGLVVVAVRVGGSSGGGL